MNKQIANKKDGFTIIEVVLVLAIAGLIFLIVFLAVPALQRNQRDTQRRSDMSRFMAQIQNFQSNNKGKVPEESKIGDFVDDYMKTGGDDWADPTTDNTYVSVSGAPAIGEFQYGVNQTCDGENFTAGGGNRKVAVRTKLEGAGFACFNN